eukprot:6192681-Pleurochrysis_carterae.AAC.1
MILDSIFTLSVEKSYRATGPSPSAFSMPRLRPIVTGGTTCGRHHYGTPLRSWCYESRRVSAVRVSRHLIRAFTPNTMSTKNV